MKVKTIKDKVAKGKKKIKGKLAAKVKSKTNCKTCACICILALIVSGCMTTQPASRATTASYGDIIVKIGDRAKNNTVKVTLGDGALASADSAGSTETQTTSPVMDIKPDIDINYNDAFKAATDASRGVLERLTDAGAKAVLKMMATKATGSVSVPTKTGDNITVYCKDGQCSECADCAK